MRPDFSKKTVDTLSKRAGFICSNPDCRVKTIGPNAEPDKAISIGEAAHIHGARKGAKRFDPQMRDATRSAITNAIWLCRNCHKAVDSDEVRYNADILFRWREQHEKLVTHQLGSKTDSMAVEQLDEILSQFNDYPMIIRRIAIDKPDGWELRLTAELMRHLNAPAFRRIKDLRENLYLKSRNHVQENEVNNWFVKKLGELSVLVPPMVNLIEKLNKSWGEPGVDGDMDEIHHISKLIRDYLEQIVQFEESLSFVKVPEKYEKLLSMLQSQIGTQVLKIESMPDRLDNMVDRLEELEANPDDETTVVEDSIVFEFPENWEKEFIQEMRRAFGTEEVSNKRGCASTILIVFILVLAISIL